MKKALLIIAMLAVGCLPHRETCTTPGGMRCTDNQPELCTTDKLWMPEGDGCDGRILFDGGTVDWKCCMQNKEAVCKPECER